ncbi:MAG TPA: hypothetical protein VLD84_07755 [Nitrososphaeraceae archaeon]|nr:hypothetical protein [Nitrososphaeraceae archaeon]
MSEENLPLPLEIPWKLAATSQPLTLGEPDQTSISLFVYKPDEDNLTGKFPGERLIYLKFTISVSPATLPNASPVGALGEGVPCFHLLLDLRVRKSDGSTGTIRPYFHSAAPLHRTIVETGLVGVDVFEGESDLQFMGKSGSQMYESSSSHSRTTTVGGSGSVGIGPVSLGASMQSTSTNVSAQRGVSQVVDTTQREASEERRQLTSHSMKVENVLTLLNAKYVGTPHLRFSLSPQPLHLLSVEPSDLNIWFSQLLQRRSSGIEGIQEFTTVLLVPKDQDFCVNARLRRVCVLDNPPGPLVYPEIFNPAEDLIKSYVYLTRAYPRGTPLDDFDIDITDQLEPDPSNPNDPKFVRPVLEFWAITGNGLIVPSVVSQGPKEAQVVRKYINYKHILEIWHDSIRDEYDREVARSPLERGILMGEQRELDTCFSFTGSGGVSVTGSTSSVSPLFRVPLDPSVIDIGGVVSATSSARLSERERSTEAITRWNLLENRLAIVLANQREKQEEFRLDDRDVVTFMMDRFAKLSTTDSNNIPFENALKLLGLNDRQRAKLKTAGATDLRSIALAIKRASDIERYNSDLASLINTAVTRLSIKPIKYSISSKDAVDMSKAIGKSLQNKFSNQNPKK